MFEQQISKTGPAREKPLPSRRPAKRRPARDPKEAEQRPPSRESDSDIPHNPQDLPKEELNS